MDFLKHIMAVVLLKASTAATAVDVNTGSLTLDVSGVRNMNGKVIVALYDNAKAYRGADFEAAAAIAALRPAGGLVNVTFGNLKSGNYAAVVFHDENSNFDLDFRGEVPTEGYAFSGAKEQPDEPSFREASVPVGTAVKTVSLKLFYFN